jgi:DNA polymerase-3 subunit delta
MTATSNQSAGTTTLFVVKGGDPTLVDRGVSLLLAELTAPRSTTSGNLDLAGSEPTPAVAVEDHRVPPPPSSDEGVTGVVVDALFTPAFLADRRIVVLRDAENLDGAQADELASHLAEPFAPNVLVIAVTGKALTGALAKIVKKAGHEIETSPGASTGARKQWLNEQWRGAPVHLDPAARQLLEQHLGEDVSRLHALLEVLAAAYGVDGRVTVAELEPFLGEEGGLPPWDLTDALRSGNKDTAVNVAHRMLGQGGRHPFQLLATLHKHYAAILRLDGSGVTGPGATASFLKMSPFPAQKLFEHALVLGPERARQAVHLIAEADLALRGVSGWPDELVIEVLVARLAALTPRRSAAQPGVRRPAQANDRI